MARRAVRKNRAMDGNVRIRSLAGADDPLFWPALELYVETFPRDEREPLAYVAGVACGQITHTDTGASVAMRVAEVESTLGGLCYFYADPDSRCGLLVYIVTEARFRGRGLGEALIAAALAGVRDVVGPDCEALFLECELPELATGEEVHVRERRIAWFLGRGARIISRTYTQPPMAPDRAPVPLALLAIPQRENVDWATLVRDFHRRILRYPADSEAERATLAGIEVSSRGNAQTEPGVPGV